MAVETVDEPRLRDDEVIVQPEAAGICGSEIEGYLGRMSNRTPPLVMGHEFAGTVAAAGGRAGREWSGRRVAVNPLLSCRSCARCVAGERNLCAQRRLIGVHVAGGFAERVAVPAANLVALPDRVDARTGALVEPLANAVHAVGLVRPGGAVLLLGLHEDESALPFHRVVRDQVALQGSFAYADADFAAALELLTSGTVSLGELTGTLPLDAGPEAFAALAAGPTAQLKTFLSLMGS